MRGLLFLSVAIISTMFGTLLTLTVLWWHAKGNGWTNWLVWDTYNEQWIEGMLLHAAIPVYIGFCVWAWRLARRVAGNERSASLLTLDGVRSLLRKRGSA